MGFNLRRKSLCAAVYTPSNTLSRPCSPAWCLFLCCTYALHVCMCVCVCVCTYVCVSLSAASPRRLAVSVPGFSLTFPALLFYHCCSSRHQAPSAPDASCHPQRHAFSTEVSTAALINERVISPPSIPSLLLCTAKVSSAAAAERRDHDEQKVKGLSALSRARPRHARHASARRRLGF